MQQREDHKIVTELRKVFVVKELSKNCDRIEKSFLIGKELSHNYDRIATKYYWEGIVTQLSQNCNKKIIGKELSQN